MKKQEFLAMSFHEGLKVKLSEKAIWDFTEMDGDNSHLQNIFTIDSIWKNGFIEIIDETGYSIDIEPDDFDYLIFLVRSFFDLTKECTQADYNDGKPFIPILELAKMQYPKFDWAFKNGRPETDFKAVFLEDDLFFYISTVDGRDADNQIKIFQQLIKWHFDLITEDCQKVYVTDDFNPYKP